MNQEKVLFDDYAVSKITAERKAYFWTKRIFDILLSIVGMAFLLPLALIIKVCYVCSGDFSSIFYKQQRLGRYGKTFMLYKFRTMVPDAEKVLAKWLEGNEEISEEYYRTRKLENDPRITKIGNILRVTSLDEFPQFINVFKGDMSLIGPRPIVLDEIENYNKTQAKKFLSLRPGLTGYWAANGRSCTTYQKRKRLELYYIDHCSIWLDIKIILSTIVKVIKRDGAK